MHSDKSRLSPSSSTRGAFSSEIAGSRITEIREIRDGRTLRSASRSRTGCYPFVTLGIRCFFIARRTRSAPARCFLIFSIISRSASSVPKRDRASRLQIRTFALSLSLSLSLSRADSHSRYVRFGMFRATGASACLEGGFRREKSSGGFRDCRVHFVGLEPGPRRAYEKRLTATRPSNTNFRLYSFARGDKRCAALDGEFRRAENAVTAA